jgi:hypothetical protein
MIIMADPDLPAAERRTVADIERFDASTAQ